MIRRASGQAIILFALGLLGSTWGFSAQPLDSDAPDSIAAPADTPSDNAPDSIDEDRWSWPQFRDFDVHRALLHVPQVRAWPEFASVDAIVAIEFFPEGATEALLATVKFSGNTELKFDQRLVVVTEPVVEEVIFPGGDYAQYVGLIKQGVRHRRLEIPLDIFLAYLADDVLSGSAPAGFNTDAPPIHVVESPTVLLFVDGAPFWKPLEKTGLEILGNANWPLVRNPTTGQMFLLSGEVWLSAGSLTGPWQATRTLPAGLSKLSADTAHPGLAAAVPAPASEQAIPAVIYANSPAELIVLDGPPALRAIDSAKGLEYVANTASPLFRYAGRWYYLVAGRWFANDALSVDGWVFSPKLPEAFASIADNHAMAVVRASVPGTVEARMAVLEAMLPRQATLPVGAAPDVDVSYDGEPQFESAGVGLVMRAVNTRFDVLQVGDSYYLCYAGAWYDSNSPTGPWSATSDIPGDVYLIPAESPSYPVTHVNVAATTPSTVTYNYTPAYTSSVYVAYGVPWYGTGWYYPPYVGYYYYPYYPSYGHGNYYNPATGTYGSRSVYYGPYGGYTYNEAYNPQTGRYGYVETAWDGDEWESYGQTHNERTGVSTETSRYYSEDKDRMTTNRTIEGDEGWMKTERKVDYNDRWSETTRETSEGGTSEVRRDWDQQGNLNSSGTISAADGRTATVEGDYNEGQGSTTISGSEGGGGTVTRSVDGSTVNREGSFSNAEGDSVTGSSQRQGENRSTQLESSSGASLNSVASGRNRATVAESANGDLYAGHNGNVYKKSGDDWQHYDGNSGQWQQSGRDTQAGSGGYTGNAGSGNYKQLNRDASARDRGQGQYNQRQSMAGRRGGFSGGGRMRGRR